MQRALDLAWRGWGRVAPNPMVGAVVLHGGSVVGEGWHAEFGGPHAEVVALQAAGDRARGATVVVTLEPCSHHGKTPPCTDALLAAGVERVVAAIRDPDPDAGGGVDVLRAKGVAVVVGVHAAAAAALNAAFLFVRQHPDRPFVALKLATSIDSRIGDAAGHSSLRCERGGALGAKLLADGLVDRLYWIQSPVWLGDGAIPAFPGVPDAKIETAPHWVPVERRPLGPDTLLVLDRTLCLPAS